MNTASKPVLQLTDAELQPLVELMRMIIEAVEAGKPKEANP